MTQVTYLYKTCRGDFCRRKLGGGAVGERGTMFWRSAYPGAQLYHMNSLR